MGLLIKSAYVRMGCMTGAKSRAIFQMMSLSGKLHMLIAESTEVTWHTPPLPKCVKSEGQSQGITHTLTVASRVHKRPNLARC